MYLRNPLTFRTADGGCQIGDLKLSERDFDDLVLMHYAELAQNRNIADREKAASYRHRYQSGADALLARAGDKSSLAHHLERGRRSRVIVVGIGETARRWTKWEDQALLREDAAGRPVSEMARKLKRTPQAIKSRRQGLRKRIAAGTLSYP